MSLLMFNDYCHNVLNIIGSGIVSLRVTLTNTIDLIDIEPHVFDKLLRSDLVKVCSRMPFLKTCRLPFNYDDRRMDSIGNYSLKYEIVLSNLLNLNQLRTLTIGIHTSQFLERLLLCIPFIENLSFTIRDRDNHENDNKITLPVTINAHHLRYLSLLSMYCLDSISFHRMVTLLSSVFGQLDHLALKLEVCMLISDPLIISGDMIQQLCIDHLKPMATYSLSLLLNVENDLQDKFVFNSFLKVPFIDRQRPRFFVQKYKNYGISHTCHSFMIYTFPYKDKVVTPHTYFLQILKST
ncbi:hypothetical protein I4U23_020009 [Adineta vaga]|nr:hypothetical protein I4U23_020009 [Adineta vaga]